MKRLVNFRLIALLVVLVSMGVGAALPTLASSGFRALSVASSARVSSGAQALPGQSNASAISGNAPLNWPEFRENASRDGDQSSNTMLSKANAGSLVPVTGPAFTTTGASMSSPAIYHGILYYATNTPQGVLQVSTLYAVNAMTGQTLWSEPFPHCQNVTQQEYVFSSPAVTTGLVNGVATTEVFIGWGGSGESAVGCVYAFNGQTGAVIWTFATQRSVYSSPAIMSINGGRIVVVGDNADFVHAFSVNYSGPPDGNGVQLWLYDTRNDAPPPGYAKYCKQTSQKCGDAIWSSPAEGLVMVHGTPHHFGYFGLGAEKNTVGRLDAIDLDTITNSSPTLQWSFWDPHPLFDDDFGTDLVYTNSQGFAVRVFTSMHNGRMFGLDAVTGKLYFNFSTSAQLGNIQTMIHSTGTLVNINGSIELIFGSGCSSNDYYPKCDGPENGYIWSIDALSTASGGTVLWHSRDFGGDIVSSPVTVNQGAHAVVFVLGPWASGASSRGDLLAIDPANGTVLGDYPVYNQYGAVSSPAIYGGRIFVTEGYNIYIRNNPGGGGLAAFRCAACA